MNRLIAAVVLSSSLLSGCGWMIADGLCAGENATHDHCRSSTMPTQPPAKEDDHTMMGVAIAGAVITTAVVIALVAKGQRDEAPARASAAPPPPRVTIIAPAPGDDRDRLLQRMYVQGYLSASTGKCEATVAIGHRLATLAPTYHDRYVDDPTIATCLR